MAASSITVRPSPIQIARMAATCGIGINGAIASGVNVLGDVHGGVVVELHRRVLQIDHGVPEYVDEYGDNIA